MATGIKDKVAILGMGCSKFGERWDCDAEDLIVESYSEAIKDAGIETSRIDAAWFSTAIEEVHVGKSGVPLSVCTAFACILLTNTVSSFLLTSKNDTARRYVAVGVDLVIDLMYGVLFPLTIFLIATVPTVYTITHTLATPLPLARNTRVVVEVDCRRHSCNAAVHNVFFRVAV